MDQYYLDILESKFKEIYMRLANVCNRLTEEDCEEVWGDVCPEIEAIKDVIITALVDIDEANAERSSE